MQNHHHCFRKSFRWPLLLALCLFSTLLCAEPRLDVVEFSSRALRNNPLKDPIVRRLAIFLPSQATHQMPIPVVYYLPGYRGSSESYIKGSEKWLAYVQKLADQQMPVLLVIGDCRTHWGGSQYLNSPAQGNYDDYISKEIVSLVETRHPKIASRKHRIIAGHSSGGFGALRLGMRHRSTFEGVIALAPDSDFQLSHLPIVQSAAVTNLTLSYVKKLMALDPMTPLPKESDGVYTLGLSAAYAPRGRFHPGQFEWPYDEDGCFRPKIWQRWMNHDPLTLALRNPHIFSARQSVYLEGSSEDKFLANVGARKIYEAIRGNPARSVFYEPPGKHSDHVPERLERGIAWFFGKPLRDIP